MKQFTKNLQLSQSVFTHLSPRPVLAVMTATKENHSLSRSIRVSIEILIWSLSIPVVSLCELLFFIRFDTSLSL